MFQLVNFTLLIATIGSGAGGMLAGAAYCTEWAAIRRCPESFFGHVDPNRHVPSYNVLLIGALCLIGALIISYQFGAEMLNFGALIGFMGVNMSSFLRYYVRSGKKTWTQFAPPLAGFIVCLRSGLDSKQREDLRRRMAGLGILYGAWKTRGFRVPIRFEAAPE